MAEYTGEVSRRQALVFLTSLPVATIGLTQGRSSLSKAPHAEDLLPLYTSGLAACRTLYFSGDHAPVEKVISSYITHLVPLAQQHGKYQRTAAGFTSQTYQLAALLAKHREDFGTALTYCKQAFHYGQVANEPNLVVSSLVREEDVLYYRRRPAPTLELDTLQQAEKYASLASPLLQGRVYSGLAALYASMNNEQQALRYKGMSHDITPENPEEDPAYSLLQTGKHMLYLNDTLVFLHLNQPDNALSAITQGMEHIPDNHALHQLEAVRHKIPCLVQLNDMEQSIDSMLVLRNARADGASRLDQSEDYSVYQSMLQKWPREARVQELEGSFHSNP